jgi:hypothetical protein
MHLTSIGGAERVQRFLLHPGPQSVFVYFRLALLILTIFFSPLLVLRGGRLQFLEHELHAHA